MAQDKTTKGHYVSQIYLKSFANDKSQCHVYDKKENKYFMTNVTNIMGERYFYDISDTIVNECKYLIKGKIEKQILEKILASTVDGYWKKIVDNIESNYEWFSIKYLCNYLNVYKCIAIQLLRTPRGRTLTAELYRRIYGKEVKKEFENIFLAKEISEVLKEVSDSFVMDYLLNNFRHICVGINNMNVPFITADNPVITLENFEEEGKDIFYYPVTPDRCIFLLKRTVVGSQLSKVI